MVEHCNSLHNGIVVGFFFFVLILVCTFIKNSKN